MLSSLTVSKNSISDSAQARFELSIKILEIDSSRRSRFNSLCQKHCPKATFSDRASQLMLIQVFSDPASHFVIL